MQTKSKAPDKCVVPKDKLSKLEGLPRDVDTFWRTDLTPAASQLSGEKYRQYKFYNKGLAFSHRERQLLGIHGLMPIAVLTIEQQVEAYQKYFATLTSELAKFIFLTDLEAVNRTLFYRLLTTDADKYLRVFMSADSGLLVKTFSFSYTTNRGMYINIKDRGHIHEILRNWRSCKAVRYLIVTTGKSVLNWGDRGVNGTPIAFYKLFSSVVHGGINPNCCLPLCLDVGTDNEQLLNDQIYVGLREKRPTVAEFDEFFEEFTLSVMRLFGPRTIIQTKDFGSFDALRQLDLYRERQCFIDIDLQCMGACGLAGILSAMNITQLPFKDSVFLFHGMTSICIGIAHMCYVYLKRLGLDDTAAKSRIWFYDSKGLVVHNRAGFKVAEQLQVFQQHHEPVVGLVESIESVKPNILIGCGLKENAFTKDVLKAMERSAKQPIIIAMSRPHEKSECTADDAFVYTKGRCIFISGVRVPPLKYANKVYQPGFCTADYMLSGLTHAVMLSGMTTVPDEAFLVAAERLSRLVWPNDLQKRDVYPPLRKLRCINLQIADVVFTFAYRRGLATLWPEPENPMHYIKSHLYNLEYTDTVPHVYCMADRMIGTSESKQYYNLKI